MAIQGIEAFFWRCYESMVVTCVAELQGSPCSKSYVCQHVLLGPRGVDGPLLRSMMSTMPNFEFRHMVVASSSTCEKQPPVY